MLYTALSVSILSKKFQYLHRESFNKFWVSKAMNYLVHRVTVLWNYKHGVTVQKTLNITAETLYNALTR